MSKLPVCKQEFAETFVILQEKRQLTNYDPMYNFTRFDVQNAIYVAESRAIKLQTSANKDKISFFYLGGT